MPTAIEASGLYAVLLDGRTSRFVELLFSRQSVLQLLQALRGSGQSFAHHRTVVTNHGSDISLLQLAAAWIRIPNGYAPQASRSSTSLDNRWPTTNPHRRRFPLQNFKTKTVYRGDPLGSRREQLGNQEALIDGQNRGSPCSQPRHDYEDEKQLNSP